MGMLARGMTLAALVAMLPLAPGVFAAAGKGAEKADERKEAFSYEGPPYRAVQRTRFAGTETVQRIFVMPGRRRVELQHPGAGAGAAPAPAGAGMMPGVVIEREDLGVQWTLFPQMRTFMEQAHHRPRIRKVLEGEEKVKGRTLRRYRYEMETGEGKVTGTLWEDERGIPHRMVQLTPLPGGRTLKTEIVWEQIRVGKLDESLFELPAGYRPFPAGIPILPGQMAPPGQAAPPMQAPLPGMQVPSPH